MRQYVAFTKKEFMEVTRNYRLFIMGIVFILLGMMNPLTAKLTPKLLSSVMPKEFMITITEPTALDSWMQFYKNVPQMGLIVMVILFSGIIAAEFSKGTLINMLTKGMKRRTVILSKFTMASLVWTGSFLLCFLVSYGYTAYFWKDKLNHLMFAAFCLWLFGILLLSVLVFGGTLFPSSYGNLLCCVAFVMLLFGLNLVPKWADYNPIALATKNMDLLTDKLVITDMVIPLVIAGVLTVLFVIAAVGIFNKKKV